MSFPATTPRPSPGALLHRRALSSAASPSHPTACTCGRCATAPASGFPSSISRPGSATPTALRVGAAALVGARGMKVRSAVKKYCEACSIVKRNGTVFVICPKDPKHKQRQG